MSNMTAAFSSLATCFQVVAAATPTITSGAQTVAIIPGSQGVSAMFLDGGTGDGGELIVQTLASDWGSVPAKLSVVSIASMASGPAKSYQVLNTEHREGTITFTLGNRALIWRRFSAAPGKSILLASINHGRFASISS